MMDYSLKLEEHMASLNHCLSSLEFQDLLPSLGFLSCICSPTPIREILPLFLQLTPLQLFSSLPSTSTSPSSIR